MLCAALPFHDEDNDMKNKAARVLRKMKCSHCHGSGSYGYCCTCKVCMGRGWVLR